MLEWRQPPKVNDNRIDGSVQVSNGTHDTFDLTVIIVAVADNGRATAIGYEHFPLKPGASNVEITFGNTLPNGPYVIHADAIAEISKRNVILRQRLQTPQALQVLQGPLDRFISCFLSVLPLSSIFPHSDDQARHKFAFGSSRV